MSNVEFECPASLQEDADFQSHASLVFQQLLDSAPSDSSLSAGVSKTGQQFHAQVSIHSVNGLFAAEATGENPIHALETVRGSANEQLSAWKSAREAI